MRYAILLVMILVTMSFLACGGDDNGDQLQEMDQIAEPEQQHNDLPKENQELWNPPSSSASPTADQTSVDSSWKSWEQGSISVDPPVLTSEGGSVMVTIVTREYGVEISPIIFTITGSDGYSETAVASCCDTVTYEDYVSRWWDTTFVLPANSTENDQSYTMVASSSEIEGTREGTAIIQGIVISGEVVIVPATEPWFDSGIFVSAGDNITFRATGQWKHHLTNPWYGPEGTASSTGNHSLPGAPRSCLVGRIGNGDAFYIGAGTTVKAVTDGNIHLIINDDMSILPDYYNDNRGEMIVTIGVGK